MNTKKKKKWDVKKKTISYQNTLNSSAAFILLTQPIAYGDKAEKK